MTVGKIVSAKNNSEYGRTELLVKGGKLLEGIPEKSVCWMSHTDYIKDVPDGFVITAITKSCPCAAMENVNKNLYGVQFHPEVTHTEYGMKMLANFIFNVCKCKADWKMDDFAKSSIEKYRKELEGKRVLLGL